MSRALASRAENKDPLDLAVLAEVKDGARQSSYRVTHFQPFDPVHKRTESDVSTPGGPDVQGHENHFRTSRPS